MAFVHPHLVFVYGTLKRGEPNHATLTNEENGKAIFIGDGRTEKEYPLVIACRHNIPFLLAAEGKGKHIEGEFGEILLFWEDFFK